MNKNETEMKRNKNQTKPKRHKKAMLRFKIQKGNYKKKNGAKTNKTEKTKKQNRSK